MSNVFGNISKKPSPPGFAQSKNMTGSKSPGAPKMAMSKIMTNNNSPGGRRATVDNPMNVSAVPKEGISKVRSRSPSVSPNIPKSIMMQKSTIQNQPSLLPKVSMSPGGKRSASIVPTPQLAPIPGRGRSHSVTPPTPGMGASMIPKKGLSQFQEDIKPSGSMIPGKASMKPSISMIPGKGNMMPGGSMIPGKGSMMPGGSMIPGKGSMMPGGSMIPGKGSMMPGGSMIPGKGSMMPAGSMIPGKGNMMPAGSMSPGKGNIMPGGSMAPGKGSMMPGGSMIPGKGSMMPGGSMIPGKGSMMPGKQNVIPGKGKMGPTGSMIPGKPNMMPGSSMVPGKPNMMPRGSLMLGKPKDMPSRGSPVTKSPKGATSTQKYKNISMKQSLSPRGTDLSKGRSSPRLDKSSHGIPIEKKKMAKPVLGSSSGLYLDKAHIAPKHIQSKLSHKSQTHSPRPIIPKAQNEASSNIDTTREKEPVYSSTAEGYSVNEILDVYMQAVFEPQLSSISIPKDQQSGRDSLRQTQLLSDNNIDKLDASTQIDINDNIDWKNIDNIDDSCTIYTSRGPEDDEFKKDLDERMPRKYKHPAYEVVQFDKYVNLKRDPFLSKKQNFGQHYMWTSNVHKRHGNLKCCGDCAKGEYIYPSNNKKRFAANYDDPLFWTMKQNSKNCILYI